MRGGGLYCLFFLSGASALIYEVVWQRLLNLVFGVSTLSVSAVLAAFMMGLALGSFLFGRLADRTSRPLWCYAWLEAGIAASGSLVQPAFMALTGSYISLHTALQPGPWGGACLRFGMALLILVVPATLIGGTLPIMGRLALRHGNEPATFSLLYAMNTLGAVTGSALTGFVFLHYLGMRRTFWIAAFVNLLVALSAGLGSRKEARGPSVWRHSSPPPVQRKQTVLQWMAIGCAGMTGAVSMALEVTWTRVLGILTSNSAYGFALVLTVFLLGLSAGGLVQSWWPERRGASWRRLAICQWLLAGVTLLSLPFLHSTPGWLERCCDGSSATAVFLGELALTSCALFVPSVLMGSSLPLLVAPAATDRGNFGRRLSRIYAANTLGCVVGPFLAGFLFIPWLGLQATFGIIIASALFVGVIAWVSAEAQFSANTCSSDSKIHRLLRFGGLRPFYATLLPALLLTGAAVSWTLLPPGRYLKSELTEPRRLLFYREGNNATVSVVEESGGLRSILVDGQPVAGTTHPNAVDQKMLAHLPLLLHRDPRRALTVGFGSGGTSHSMMLHRVRVDCVEIEAAVPAAAAYFGPENEDVLSEPAFRLIVDDARSWLRVAPQRYDVIVTDCTNIQYRSNGDLYTVDYFRLMKERLTEQGLAAAWVPANGIADRDLKTLLRTFRDVFPHTSVWYMNTRPTDFLIVIGTPGVLDIDVESLRRRMLVPAIAQDLSTVGLADPCRLLYTFLAADDDLSTYLGSGALNTDDRPILSYSTYGATFRSTIAGNLLRLLACRGDVARFVRHPPPRETMLRHYAASNQSILGHIAHLAGTEEAALAQYQRGVRLLPDDPALQELVSTASWSLETRSTREQNP